MCICITCIVYRTVISVEHFPIGSAVFFLLLNSFAVQIDCSQSPGLFFGEIVGSTGRHLGLSMVDASDTGESTECPWVVAVGFIA